MYGPNSSFRRSAQVAESPLLELIRARVADEVEVR
jgi:hypothetical protein